MIKAILFDVEGVLLDTSPFHFTALNAALEAHGVTISPYEHITVYDGMPSKRKLQMLTERKGLPEELHGAIHSEKRRIMAEEIRRQVTPDRFKQALMLTLRTYGWKIGVCCNAVQDTVGSVVAALGIGPWVDVAIGIDARDRLMESASLFTCAAHALGVTIEECVIVVQSPTGLAAAVASGCEEIVQVDGPSGLAVSLLKPYLPLQPVQDLSQAA